MDHPINTQSAREANPPLKAAARPQKARDQRFAIFAAFFLGLFKDSLDHIFP